MMVFEKSLISIELLITKAHKGNWNEKCYMATNIVIHNFEENGERAFFFLVSLVFKSVK